MIERYRNWKFSRGWNWLRRLPCSLRPEVGTSIIATLSLYGKGRTYSGLTWTSALGTVTWSDQVPSLLTVSIGKALWQTQNLDLRHNGSLTAASKEKVLVLRRVKLFLEQALIANYLNSEQEIFSIVEKLIALETATTQGSRSLLGFATSAWNTLTRQGSCSSTGSVTRRSQTRS